MVSVREERPGWIARAKAGVRGRPALQHAAAVLRSRLTSYPTTAEALRQSDIYKRWWYYSVELLPGVITNGQYEDSFPMLPRLLLRKCGVEGADCLDMGAMEGLIPTLIARRGARSVLAVDAVPHCVEKLAAVRHYHRVDFDYQNVGLMYELDKKLPGRSFDLINCSGLLYHVVSPFMVLAGVRPLLKRNGLVVVSTNVVDTDEYTMEFNVAGRLQRELNTFWYMSIPLLYYVLRYLALAPLDVVYVSHGPHEQLRTGRKAGFLSVVCRAVDAPLPTAEDTWMSPSVRESWESKGLVDWERARRQQVSAIQYHGAAAQEDLRSDTGSVDLTRAVRRAPPLDTPPNMSDTHRLALADAS